MEERDFAEVFREEAGELLEELETSLLELEKSPGDLKLVARVFRAMHTIKGSGAMFGFDQIAAFTHHVETVMDKVRDGRVPVSPRLIGLVLASRDHIKSLLEGANEDASVSASRGDGIIRELEALVAESSSASRPAPEVKITLPAEPPATPAEMPPSQPIPPSPPSPPPAAEPPPARPKEEKPLFVPPPSGEGKGFENHYSIYFRPRAEFFEEGGEVGGLLDGLRDLGEVTVVACREPETEAGAAAEAPFWDLVLTTASGINAVRDVFIFAESTSSVKIVSLDKEEDGGLPEHRRLGEILIERGDIDAGKLDRVLSSQKPLGALLVEEKAVPEASVKSALAQQKVIQEKRDAGRKSQAADNIRVSSDKLDMLINLVGELVVTQARLSQVTAGASEPQVVASVEDIERLTTELRDCVLSVRMLPIGSTFSRFNRLVRDLSSELGKEIELVTEGAETELDKSVIDQIGEPLVHLIRNSIDHGLEPPADRLAAAKPVKGRIILSAVQAGANVVISVADDGRGLDVEAIRRKAVAKGLVPADAEMSEEDIYKCVFEPGFSTSEQVSSVSGRGVGMDVVKTTIEGELKGTVDISSRKGEGTVVAITLPLTLAIIDGLLVRAGETHFVLPLSQVEECVELTREDVGRFHGRRLYPLRDQLVPYVRMRDFYRLGGEHAEIEQMVIVHANRQRLGLVLDDVIGGYQTVIKSLGWVYRNAEGISGATILGNGEVALIVDIVSLMRFVRQEESRRDRRTMEAAVH